MPNNAFEAGPPRANRAPSPDGALILRVQTLENEIKQACSVQAMKQCTLADKQLKAAAEENTRLKNEVEKLQRQERDLTNKLKENPGHTQRAVRSARIAKVLLVNNGQRQGHTSLNFSSALSTGDDLIPGSA